MTIKTQVRNAVCFILLCTIVTAILSPLFTPENKLGSIAKEPEYSLDYIVLGDSECYTSISPMELWNAQGYVGYNCGVSVQRIQDTYYLMKEVLNHQKPRVILLETNLIHRKQVFQQEIQTMLDRWTASYIGIYRYHDRWKQMVSNTTQTADAENKIFKGNPYNTAVHPYTRGNYVKQTEKVKSIDALQKKFLDEIVSLCEEKNIQLILYSAPSPVCWSMAKHNGIAAYAKEHELSYVDLNLMTEELGIDWAKDTYDKGDHLNFYGAQKVTAYLAEYLKKNTALPDRRNDAVYAAWDSDWNIYRSRTGQTNTTLKM